MRISSFVGVIEAKLLSALTFWLIKLRRLHRGMVPIFHRVFGDLHQGEHPGVREARFGTVKWPRREAIRSRLESCSRYAALLNKETEMQPWKKYW